MPRKMSIKIGDRVCLKEFPDTTRGVVIFEEAPIDLKGNPTDKVWSVHWHTTHRNIVRRDMEYGRGIYSVEELIKKPNDSNNIEANADV